MAKFSAIAAAALTIAALAVAVVVVFFNNQSSDCSTNSVAGGDAAIGGPFTLVNQFGQTVTDKDVITGPTLIYFGYTFCPDVCPLDLARNVEAIDILDERGEQVTPVFITIDPARDTPEELTYYAKVGDGPDYLMDHLTYSYLMSPKGFVDFFRRDVTPEDMADTISCYINSN